MSTNSSAAYSLQWLSIKPYWLSKNRLALLKYEDNWVRIIYLMHLTLFITIVSDCRFNYV